MLHFSGNGCEINRSMQHHLAETLQSKALDCNLWIGVRSKAEISRWRSTVMAAKVIGPSDGKLGFLGSIGVRFMIWGADVSGRFSVVEHTMSPGALAAPMQRHSREDEYSYVLRGRLGALLGDDVVFGVPGDLVFKPRNQWHTFWNAGDEPASILEIISPAGFEQFFSGLSDLGGVTNIEPSALGSLCARFGLDMKPETVPELV
jgi:quercetin dioxygenase-like cupin family protein